MAASVQLCPGEQAGSAPACLYPEHFILSTGLGTGVCCQCGQSSGVSAGSCLFLCVPVDADEISLPVNLWVYQDLLWVFRGNWAGWFKRFNACLFYKHKL